MLRYLGSTGVFILMAAIFTSIVQREVIVALPRQIVPLTRHIVTVNVHCVLCLMFNELRYLTETV